MPVANVSPPVLYPLSLAVLSAHPMLVSVPEWRLSVAQNPNTNLRDGMIEKRFVKHTIVLSIR